MVRRLGSYIWSSVVDRISTDDYFLKNQEFRAWLSEEVSVGAGSGLACFLSVTSVSWHNFATVCNHY